MQAFSRVRDDWIRIGWTGMNSNGNYAIIFFVGIARFVWDRQVVP